MGGAADLTITVTDADGGVEERRAGEDEEAERPYRAEFGPFRPGAYLVDSPELAISAEVELSADEAAVVTLMGEGLLVFSYWLLVFSFLVTPFVRGSFWFLVTPEELSRRRRRS